MGNTYLHTDFLPPFLSLCQSTTCYLIRGTLLTTIQYLLSSSSSLSFQQTEVIALQQFVIDNLAVMKEYHFT